MLIQEEMLEILQSLFEVYYYFRDQVHNEILCAVFQSTDLAENFLVYREQTYPGNWEINTYDENCLLQLAADLLDFFLSDEVDERICVHQPSRN